MVSSVNIFLMKINPSVLVSHVPICALASIPYKASNKTQFTGIYTYIGPDLLIMRIVYVI